MSALPISLPAGNFSGQNTAVSYAIDETTGFLTAANEYDHVLGQRIQFNASKKLQFLVELSKCWPNYTHAAKCIGISRNTFRNHYAMDPKFRLLVDEIAEEKTDEIEGVSVEMAKLPKGVIDRMCQLRANRSDKYDPARKIIIQAGGAPDAESALARMRKLESVIDGEVIKAQFSEERKGRRLEAGGEGA